MIIQERYLDRSSISINGYLKEVSKFKVLTPKDEVKYIELAQAGDEGAKQILIKANLRFVISVAKQYQNSTSNVMDLISEGNIGLIDAIEKFDHTRGFKLISYAVWHIRRRIIEFSKKNNDIYDIPQSKIGNQIKLKKLIGKMECELERNVYPEDLYGLIDDINDDMVDELYYIINNVTTTSLSHPVGDDSLLFGDLIPSSSYDDVVKNEDEEFNIEYLSMLINELPLRLRGVMGELYGLNGCVKLSREEYGEKYDIGIPRVRQLHDSSVRALRGIGRRITSGQLKPQPKQQTRSELIDAIMKKSEVRDQIKVESFKRDDIDEMIAKTNYVIETEEIEKPKYSSLNLLTNLFNKLF